MTTTSSRSIGRIWLVNLLIAIPTLFTVFYFAFVAADRYESVTSVVVRRPVSSIVGQLSEGVRPSRVVRSLEDAYVAQAYLASRQAVTDLDRQIDLPAIYARPVADFVSRYPGPFSKHTKEHLFRYLRNMIRVTVNKKTGVTKIEVQAFRPQDARAIAAAMVRNAETLVNRLGLRGQEEDLRSARATLEQNRKVVEQASTTLAGFRAQHGIIDPELTAKSEIKKFVALALEATDIRIQILELQYSSPESPQLPSRRRRLAAIEAQIATENKRLDAHGASLGAIVSDYERLTLRKTLAEQIFQLAQATLEIVRVEGQRQHLFLDAISKPSEADYPQYPQRLSIVVTVLLLAAAFWRVLHWLIPTDVVLFDPRMPK